MSASPIRWGVWGCGGIAAKFCAALRLLPDARLARVAARDGERAAAFAATHGADAGGSYDQLLADDGVDVVYVAVTTAQHLAAVRALLEHGRAVVCEKPLTCSAEDTAALISLARARGVFLMEAMWTRFFPATAAVRAWLAAGRIGQVRHVHADFSYSTRGDTGHRIYDRATGGGALLDVGVYPVAMLHDLFGAPRRLAAIGRVAAGGADIHASLLMELPGGVEAVVTCAGDAVGEQALHIAGSHGRIAAPKLWYDGAETRLLVDGGEEAAPAHRFANHLAYQAEAVHAHLRAGDREAALMPLDHSLAIARTLDAGMAALGTTYPPCP